MIKNILGAGVVLVDVILGMSTPETLRGLHKETHAHLYGTYAVYAVAALLTLWVITSVAGTLSGGKPAPQRPTVYGRPR